MREFWVGKELKQKFTLPLGITKRSVENVSGQRIETKIYTSIGNYKEKCRECEWAKNWNKNLHFQWELQREVSRMWVGKELKQKFTLPLGITKRSVENVSGQRIETKLIKLSTQSERGSTYSNLVFGQGYCV